MKGCWFQLDWCAAGCVLLVYEQAMKFCEEIFQCLVTESDVLFSVHVPVCDWTILTCITAGWTCSVITHKYSELL